MEKIIKKYAETVKNVFGRRKENQACFYCGKDLTNLEYCDCSSARKINRYFKKINKKVHYLYGELDVSNSIDNIITRIENGAKTPKIFEGLKFEDYVTDNPSQFNALNSVKKYSDEAIQNFLRGKNLILLGNYGTGKTMLMSILVKSIAEKYLFYSKFINAVDLIQKIKDSFNNNNQKTTAELLEGFKKVEFLFIDDIDKIKPTDYTRELIYGLVNYRIENELPLVISANNKLEILDAEYFGEAIVSRLVQKSEVVEFTHENKRFQG